MVIVRGKLKMESRAGGANTVDFSMCMPVFFVAMMSARVHIILCQYHISLKAPKRLTLKTLLF